MSNLRQAAQQALEDLQDANGMAYSEFSVEDLYGETITALKQALAEPERQWVSLTEQEMYDLFFHDQYGPRLPEYLVNTIKCIEAALKEKNT